MNILPSAGAGVLAAKRLLNVFPNEDTMSMSLLQDTSNLKKQNPLQTILLFIKSSQTGKVSMKLVSLGWFRLFYAAALRLVNL